WTQGELPIHAHRPQERWMQLVGHSRVRPERLAHPSVDLLVQAESRHLVLILVCHELVQISSDTPGQVVNPGHLRCLCDTNPLDELRVVFRVPATLIPDQIGDAHRDVVAERRFGYCLNYRCNATGIVRYRLGPAFISQLGDGGVQIGWGSDGLATTAECLQILLHLDAAAANGFLDVFGAQGQSAGLVRRTYQQHVRELILAEQSRGQLTGIQDDGVLGGRGLEYRRYRLTDGRERRVGVDDHLAGWHRRRRDDRNRAMRIGSEQV